MAATASAKMQIAGRVCPDCSQDISHRHHRSKRCRDCQQKHEITVDLAWRKTAKARACKKRWKASAKGRDSYERSRLKALAKNPPKPRRVAIVLPPVSLKPEKDEIPHYLPKLATIEKVKADRRKKEVPKKRRRFERPPATPEQFREAELMTLKAYVREAKKRWENLKPSCPSCKTGVSTGSGDSQERTRSATTQEVSFGP